MLKKRENVKKLEIQQGKNAAICGIGGLEYVNQTGNNRVNPRIQHLCDTPTSVATRTTSGLLSLRIKVEQGCNVTATNKLPWLESAIAIPDVKWRIK